MSIEAVHWALDVPVSGNAKVVLIGLANHAHPDGTAAFPSLDTLAEYGYCDRSTVRRNLRKLESGGWIRQDGIGPRGQASWSLIYGRKTEEPPPRRDGNLQSQEAVGVANGVAVGVAFGVAPMPPEPLTETDNQKEVPPVSPSAEKSNVLEHRRKRATSQPPDPSEPPVALPTELHPVALSVLGVLTSVQAERGGDEPTIRGVGLAMLRHGNRDFVAVARDLEHWALSGRGARKPVKDWARTFATFLGNVPEGSAPRLRVVEGRQSPSDLLRMIQANGGEAS